MIATSATTPGGFLLVLAVLLPAAGILLSFVLGSRAAERIALGLTPVGFTLACLVAMKVAAAGAPIVYAIGGLPPPLGIALRADGVSAVMMLAAAVIVAAAAFYARAKFATLAGAPEARAPLIFWTLLLAVWAAMNAVFLGADLFNLYVALELLTFAAVPLVCLDGRAETLAAALRYLLFALLGSVLYLLGTVLLYGAYGTLDIVLLSSRVHAEPVAWAALSLMTAGLLAKGALYPLHLWLPPAHAGAPAPASAVLSGLVVKAPFFLVVRLWFDVMPRLPDHAAAQMLGILAAAAILFGSVIALRQVRLKLLIAYSTVAQIGYLFLIFPLAGGDQIGHPWGNSAWTGGVLQAISHAFAKAAMFMAAGLVYEALGHDRIADFRGAARALPLTFLTLGLGGLSLMGLPPTGGFEAKWLMLQASAASGQWVWSLPILGGGLLAGGYVYRILAPALADGEIEVEARPQRSREAIALGLAVIALALAFAPRGFFDFLEIGRPFASGSAP